MILTGEEWTRLVKGMKSIWTDKDFLPDMDAVEMWYNLLNDIPYENLSIAIQRYAQTNRWPPRPADLREQIAEVKVTEDWSDAWGQVLRAIGRYGQYQEEEALASMSDIGREVTCRLGWKQICQADLDELPAIRANFRMIYESKSEKAKEDNMTSLELKEHIQRIVGDDKKMLE